jgi:hypothetical protein
MLDGNMFYFTRAVALGTCRCTSNSCDENVEERGMEKDYKKKEEQRNMKGINERRKGYKR